MEYQYQGSGRDSSTAGKRRRTARAARGQLRRHGTLDGVAVEETFSLSHPTEASSQSASISINGSTDTDTNAGDGCYVTATVHNRRYYGVLVDQASLKAASDMHFQAEVMSLQLNQRMAMLFKQNEPSIQGDEYVSADAGDSKKRKFSLSESNGGNHASGSSEDSKKLTAPLMDSGKTRSIQKFQYVPGTPNAPCYRVLVATYSDLSAASNDEANKAKVINSALQCGGNFVGDFYYQYEELHSALTTSTTTDSRAGLRQSMGIHSFLQNTLMPPWYPLSNLQCNSQSKFLSMLQLKKNNSGGVEWDSTASNSTGTTRFPVPHYSIMPMLPRSSFKICVVGGGISGLACCYELLRLSSSSEVDLDVEVVLLEARSRLGGRIFTDNDTFKFDDGKQTIPVDLGAAWIHGIHKNPLHGLALEAGIELINTSDDVKMLSGGMGVISKEADNRLRNLFDQLLDKGSADCWEKEEYDVIKRSQKAVRWYAEPLTTPSDVQAARTLDVSTDVLPHRYSPDTSLDNAIGGSMKKRSRLLKQLYKDKQSVCLLQWAAKNVEYALGADMGDISMRYWDSDETHAFEGDHVLLKQGYSKMIDHLAAKCQKFGARFKCLLDCKVNRIEYARDSISQPYTGNSARERKTINLSDTCRVVYRDGEADHFDFVVSALPLGVLKEVAKNTQEKPPNLNDSKLHFDPPLPESKLDAIQSVGFGLLNKVYLQFPLAFWRSTGCELSTQQTPYLVGGQTTFGNASGNNTHLYMFVDIGRSLRNNVKDDASPAILMTLISGSHALKAEQMSDEKLIDEIMSTLRHIYSTAAVPEPIASKITRWGSDEFSRGCYCFLPPGSSDEDYHILQCPVNKNGESFVTDGGEIMRLFWAGEHTTSLHPSVSHGAFLSGIKAAKEVISSTLFQSPKDAGIERQIPIAVYRRRNPKATLKCQLCHSSTNRKSEGGLLAFKKGNRHVIVHSNCALYSAEVGLKNGNWTDVSKACNRGRQINCNFCGKNGATIGCEHHGCYTSFHFPCAENSGWNFGRDGKNFRCDLHRPPRLNSDSKPIADNSMSLAFFRFREPTSPVVCSLCREGEQNKECGTLLGFHRGSRRVLIHEKCLRYTSIVTTLKESENFDDKNFQNVFEAISQSTFCSHCKGKGATIKCSRCSHVVHYICAENTNWSFDKMGKKYVCPRHLEPSKPAASSASRNEGSFLHDLFQMGGSSDRILSSEPKHRSAKMALPSNEFVARSDGVDDGPFDLEEDSEDDVVSKAYQSGSALRSVEALTQNIEFNPNIFKKQVSITHVKRESVSAPWGISFCLQKFRQSGGCVVAVSIGNNRGESNIQEGDELISLNGDRIGKDELTNLAQIIGLMSVEVEVAIGHAR